jgi:ATP-dependent Clp protease ATP-binding subunit ClpB
MQIEKYTDRLKVLVQSAQSLALRNGHQQLTPLHILKALLDDEDRLAQLPVFSEQNRPVSMG